MHWLIQKDTRICICSSLRGKGDVLGLLLWEMVFFIRAGSYKQTMPLLRRKKSKEGKNMVCKKMSDTQAMVQFCCGYLFVETIVDVLITAQALIIITMFELLWFWIDEALINHLRAKNCWFWQRRRGLGKTVNQKDFSPHAKTSQSQTSFTPFPAFSWAHILPINTTTLQEQNTLLYLGPKDLPSSRCHFTYDATWVLDIKSQLILLSLIPESKGPAPLALFTRHCAAGNGIHIMLHSVALTSTVVITVEYRLQSA